MTVIRKAVHLWRLVDNPEMVDVGDLRNFENPSAVFYSKQGRLFVKELLALWNFHLARELSRSYTRRNKNHPRERPLGGFKRLRRELGRSFLGFLFLNHFVSNRLISLRQ